MLKWFYLQWKSFLLELEAVILASIPPLQCLLKLKNESQWFFYGFHVGGVYKYLWRNFFESLNSCSSYFIDIYYSFVRSVLVLENKRERCWGIRREKQITSYALSKFKRLHGSRVGRKVNFPRELGCKIGIQKIFRERSRIEQRKCIKIVYTTVPYPQHWRTIWIKNLAYNDWAKIWMV